jgi:hypothetical protein
MIKFRKRATSQKDPVQSGSDLASRIKSARAEAEAFIDAKTQELKNSPDGALLPIGILRQQITRHSGCACAVVLDLLEPKT